MSNMTPVYAARRVLQKKKDEHFSKKGNSVAEKPNAAWNNSKRPDSLQIMLLHSQATSTSQLVNHEKDLSREVLTTP